jgi:hypothetical protein
VSASASGECPRARYRDVGGSHDGHRALAIDARRERAAATLMRRVVLAAFAVVLVAIAAAAWMAWRALHTEVAPPNGSVVVTVQPGASFQSVAVQMHRAASCGRLLLYG